MLVIWFIIKIFILNTLKKSWLIHRVFLLTDLREMVFENQGEEANDDRRIISPHFQAGLCCTHSCFCPFCCPQSHWLFCLALKETPCLRGLLECVESSWGRKMCKIRERTHMESQMRVCLSLNVYIYAFSRRFYPKRLTGYYYYFYRYVCSLGIEPMTFCAAIAMVSTSEPQEHTEQTVNVYLVLPSASIHAHVPLNSQLRMERLTSLLPLDWKPQGQQRMMGNCRGMWALVWVQVMNAVGRSSGHNGSLLMHNVSITCEQQTLKNYHWKKNILTYSKQYSTFLWWLIISL